MKTILVTAYAINPYKGSEDGMGWNFVLQIAREHKVIAFTRKNNGPHIEKYKAAHPELASLYNNIEFRYFDWPQWTLFWKKGPVLSLIYFYGWQLTLAISIMRQRINCDLVHNLNFHNDWTPSFLWITGKPMIWGPVGHHPRIPKAFLAPVYGTREFLKDRFLWGMKQFFWTFDPFLRLAARKAVKVLAMNSEAPERLRLKREQFSIVPSVAAELPQQIENQPKNGFKVLSAGRFVPLKGFDLTIRSFASFYKSLPALAQEKTELILVGSGPSLPLLKKMISEEGISHCTRIIEWIPRQELLALYQDVSVFLFPSHEGAGMVVAEALSYQVPVVCLDNAGPGEFIHPESGLKVPYGSYTDTVKALSAKLNNLFCNQDYYQLESRLAGEQFYTCFRWDRRGDQLKSLYQEALQPAAKPVSLTPITPNA